MIDTDGHTTVLVETDLPSVPTERKKLIDRILDIGAPEMWYTPQTGINWTTVLVGGLLGVGIVLLIRRK